ncbi:MAG TPA: alpha/beta hydrolase, partial [Chitinophagaceae bacterium]|nr:alpha/beta hydrolase [Chitinophagaceae bacterium]
LVDEIYSTVNNKIKALQILYLAKSTIRNNLKKELHKITCDCCIIWGKQDAVTPPHVAEEFHQLIAHSSLKWIDNCGHVPMMETPEEFNAALSSFLKKRSNTATNIISEIA